MADRVKTLSGKLALRPWGEGHHETLFCGDSIVAEWALAQIGASEDQPPERSYGRFVRLRYWTADVEASPADIRKLATACVHAGSASVEWGALYLEREYWGTDEELMVDGYDVLGELSDSAGQYGLLELTVDDGLRHAEARSEPHG
jgi:hypothetical protein